jgi:antitoxin component of RelBE/YafQ-DinJ toxin-antitoxin module
MSASPGASKAACARPIPAASPERDPPNYPESEQSLDASLELQMISVRLQKELLEQLKFIAHHYGIGYQPLMRDVLARWARTEMLVVAEQMKQQLDAKTTIAAAKKRACG